MTTSPTLPTGPLEHLAMDYVRLRAEGIRVLGRLAGAQWTDYNTHDPGITILEQLCYAITDLGYRTAFAVPDLLAGTDLDQDMPGPEVILTGDPVTVSDLRKLVLDIPGIGNAWVEPVREPELAFHYHPGSREVRLQTDSGDADAAPVRLRGLHRVSLQTTDQLSGDAAIGQVAARLHASRALGEDFELARLGTFEVWLRARIEVDAIEDPAAVMADIIERIEANLAPTVGRTPLAEALAQGRRIDEIFEGPRMSQGLVDALPDPRRAVHVSDLIHAIMDAPHVRAVRSLELASSPQPAKAIATGRERWVLDIPSDHVATLAASSELTLLRAGLPVRVSGIREALEARRLARARRSVAARERRPPTGRTRRLARYSSLQHQLPAVYGVGALGLGPSASAQRQVQARQLAGYLLIFDQLLANAFAQLARARELLSSASGSRTYFAQPVEDPRLHLHELLRLDPAAHRAWLDAAVEPGDPRERRKRFLAHLLARFAEQLGDHPWIRRDVGVGNSPDEAVIADRQEFLRRYPRLSGARGSGADILRDDDTGDDSGFAGRIRWKLGLHGHPRFHVVEHVLLRPIAEDAGQLADEGDPQVPLLADVAAEDPWSLQISLVFEERGAVDETFEQLVAQTILAETPAHLTPHLHWFGATDGQDHWSAFDGAWLAFRAAYRAYRRARLQAAQIPEEIHLRVRDARDRVIDLLGFGRTYPLRDLPLRRHVIVAPGASAAISIAQSQRGVVYRLCDRTGVVIERAGKPVELDGTGETIELVTPAIHEDVSYRVLAVKLAAPGSAEPHREAWLHGVVRIEEGVDPALVAQLRLPLLDLHVDDPQPADARIADHNAVVEVEVLASQEGVVYELLDAADPKKVLSQQSVVGTSGTIVLRTLPVREDIDLRVRGSKGVGDPQHPDVRSALLDVVLSLRVRADPRLVAELVPAAIVQHEAAAALRVAQTQKSAEYRVWRRRVRDGEFVFAEPPPVPTIDVTGDDGRTIRVVRPARAPVWQDLGGFVPAGDARAGTGAALEFPLAGLTEDTLLLVQAIKHHRKNASPVQVASAVQLDRALAVFVRPDHRQALRIQVSLSGDATTGPLLVRDGQPGVFYTLQRGDQPIARPAYFHQRDEDDAQFNKGIAQLRVEVDVVIARDPGEAVDRARTAPPAPSLAAEPLPVGTDLRVVARKAMSGLVAPLEGTLTITKAPAIHAVPASVTAGAAAQIVIEASVASERYRLLRDGEVMREATGTDGPLELDTGPLQPSSALQVEILSTFGAMVVERRVVVAIVVKT